MVKIEDDDESEAICELIDCLFVHQWPKMSLKLEQKPNIDQDLKQYDNDDEDDNDEFDYILSNLNDLKEKATQLSFEERKKFAEEIAVKFWKSIGGQDDEINGLEDDFLN